MTIQIIREVLETHCLAGDPGYDEFDRALSSGLTQKCTGCPWIGWDHRLHVAKMIDERLGLVEESSDLAVFVYDDPPAMTWWGLEEVPARHCEFIPHTRLVTAWHGDECPDCAEEPGVHERRRAEILAAADSPTWKPTTVNRARKDMA
jgi:hypothetical protein